jgi:hypothetical protein
MHETNQRFINRLCFLNRIYLIEKRFIMFFHQLLLAVKLYNHSFEITVINGVSYVTGKGKGTYLNNES